MAECLLTIIGREDMGMGPTKNGKDRPQKSVVVPVSGALRGKCVYRSALARHIVGCKSCDPNAPLRVLLEGDHRHFGRWEQFARRMLADPRTDRGLAFAVAWKYEPLKALTLPITPHDVIRGFEMAPIHHYETARRFQVFVEDIEPDGYFYQEKADLVQVLSRPQTKGTRLFTDRGPRISRIPAEMREVVAAAIELRRAGWGVDASSEREFWDRHTMWSVEYS